MYKVYIDLNENGDVTGEYSGKEHNNYESARRELKVALDDDVYFAWIEEVREEKINADFTV